MSSWSTAGDWLTVAGSSLLVFGTWAQAWASLTEYRDLFKDLPQAARAALEVSIRLDPRDPLLAWHLNRVAIAHYFAGDYEAAIEAAQRVIRSYPEFPLIYRWLAAALGQASRTEEARQALQKAIAIGAGTFDMYVRRRVPWHRPEDYEHMLDGLHKAGWQG